VIAYFKKLISFTQAVYLGKKMSAIFK